MQLKQSFSWEEVAKHNTTESCYIVISGEVYDVTKWLPYHPGGSAVLTNMAGLDSTDAFLAYHTPEVRKRLSSFKIGVLDGYKVSSMLKEYRSLMSEIEASPLMKTDNSFYVKLYIWVISIFCSSVFLILFFRENFWLGTVLSSVLMATYFQQIAFIGHDLAHGSVIHGKKSMCMFGIFLGNFATGISMGWWRATHNTHHICTNVVTSDPDIQHLPMFALSSQYFKSPYSFYHNRVLPFDRIAKFLVPIQSYYFYFVMAIARVNLYAQSYMFLLQGEKKIVEKIGPPTLTPQERRLEIAGLAFFIIWFSFLVSFIPHTSWKVVFCFMSHILAGILHLQINLSHWAMPTIDDSSKHPLINESFLEHQLKTTCDINNHPALDWFHGGLNFQSAHHVLPRVPRHNLRKLQRILQEFCSKHNIVYTTFGFMKANKIVLNRLNNVSAAARIEMYNDILKLNG